MLPSLISRNVVVSGQRTSFRLEPEMWSALDLICQQEHTDVHSLCTWISTYKPRSNRTSAIRAFIVSYLRAQIDGVQTDLAPANQTPVQNQDEMSEGLRQLFRAAG
ncbi:MAG: ribbon-helix-helix domain-containing protein [Terasakiella sp.]|uniref:ribbon-helix-helix domain-containing protein n=1 Tax=unclassified Terasakiella TaxID=2614952 RepID=UPI003B0011D9